jgi:hypothetical protein
MKLVVYRLKALVDFCKYGWLDSRTTNSREGRATEKGRSFGAKVDSLVYGY